MLDPEPVHYMWSILFLFLSSFIIFCQYCIVETPDLSIKKGDIPSQKSHLLKSILLSSRQFALSMRVGYSFFFMCYSYAFVGSIYTTPLVQGWYEHMEKWDILITVAIAIVSTLIQLTFGRGFPRRMALRASMKTTTFIVPVAKFFAVLFLPPAIFIENCVGLLMILTGGEFKEKRENVTEDEILMMLNVGEEHGTIEQSEKEMIHNVFDFGDRTASEIMTHRTEVVFCTTESTLSEIIKLGVQDGFSRLPVCGESSDDIVGILNTKDLLAMVTTPDKDFSVEKYMRKPIFVPQSTKCDDLFTQLNEEKTQIAIVVDEYGGTCGIVSMEDIIESVFGDIQDEYDDEEDESEKHSEHLFTLDGSMSIEDVEELLGCDLEQHNDQEYETIGGMMLGFLDNIPAPDDRPTVNIGDFDFTVKESNSRQILRILAVRNRHLVQSHTTTDE